MKSIFLMISISVLLFAKQDVSFDNIKEDFLSTFLEKYDEDKDSKISLNEFVKVFQDIKRKSESRIINREIKICDTNNNNMIDKDELVSKEEYRKNPSLRTCFMSIKTFLKIDTNQDNSITKKEYVEFISSHQPNPLNPNIVSKYKNLNIKGKIKSNLNDKIKKEMVFRVCNCNHDTKIDMQESKQCDFPKRLFKELDRNKNNVLDKDDYQMLQYKKRFDRFDLDRSGFVEKDELDNMSRFIFRRL